MKHISVNLAMGRREKIFWVQKAPGGGKEAIKGRPKILLTFFDLFLLDTKVFGYKKLQGVAKRL